MMVMTMMMMMMMMMTMMMMTTKIMMMIATMMAIMITMITIMITMMIVVMLGYQWHPKFYLCYCLYWIPWNQWKLPVGLRVFFQGFDSSLQHPWAGNYFQNRINTLKPEVVYEWINWVIFGAGNVLLPIGRHAITWRSDESKYKIHLQKCIWKCCLWKGGLFIQASMS